MVTVLDILEEIRSLTLEERKQLMRLMVDTLTEPEQNMQGKHNLRELRGLGKEIWEGIDAQDYVNQQRDEWDQHQ
ncbi:MAG: hypothetical protein IAE83_14370 [Anaerolinea sp.]|nr:hypothetical protein [Anaerolinea sp.]CAG0970748.1 hypothetical protein ANRL4_01244 [Anaerolineae bacterium]